MAQGEGCSLSTANLLVGGRTTGRESLVTAQMRDHLAYRTYLHALLGVCGVVLAAAIAVAWRDPSVEPYDAANYVEVARNVLAGRGLSSEVVGNFYRQYPEVLHAEDRRASAWSLVLAASMRLLGETSFAATLPNLLLGLLAGPLLVYALARRLVLVPPVCFAAAVLFLAWPHWLKESLGAGADVLFTDLTILALLLLIATRNRSRLILACAATLGLAYTVKPAALFLVLPLAVFFWLDASRLAAGRRLGWLAAFLGVALVFAAPMLVRNYRLFGQPFYSTNLCTAGHIGTDDSGRALMHVYWGEPLPSLGKWLGTSGVVGSLGKSFRELGRAGRELFGGIGLFFALPSLLVIVTPYHRRARRLWIFLGLFVAGLAVLWIPYPRLLLPIVPVITLSAAAGGLTISQQLMGSLRRATGGLLVVTVLVAGLGLGGYGWWRFQPASVHSRLQPQLAAARWPGSNLPPDTVVMSPYPYLVRSYSSCPVVQIPFDDAGRIRQVIAHYGVNTLMIPRSLARPTWAADLPQEALQQLVAEAGWTQVYENSGVSVFHRAPIPGSSGF